VLTYHSWAGSTSPTIKGVESIEYGGELVGYNFLVSPAGHLVVPLRDELPPVKLYSEHSTLSMADNSDVVQWIQEEVFRPVRYIEEHESEFTKTYSEATPNGRLWTILGDERQSFSQYPEQAASTAAVVNVGPLLTTLFWSQLDPYWRQTPLWYDGRHTYTGCDATAAAQIMYYWNYPASGQNTASDYFYNGQSATTLTVDFSQSTYDWSNMLQSYDGVATDAQNNAVAKLMADVGIAFQMAYGPYNPNKNEPQGSSASTSDGATVFPTYFKYKSSIHLEYHDNSKYKNSDGIFNESAWMQVFKTEVLANRPSMLQIRDDSKNANHAVVVDGYRDSPSETIHINLGWGDNLGYETWYVSNDIVTLSPNAYDFADPGFQLAVIRIEPQTVPTVDTTATSNLSSNTVTLNGTVNPNGVPASMYFEWGTTDTYGNTTPSQSMGSGSTQLGVSVNLSGLLANTTYHYRLVAYNNSYTASGEPYTGFGPDVTFTTAKDQTLTVVTRPATNLTSSSATLNGSVATNGSSATAYFKWGPTAAYGNSTNPQTIRSGLGSFAVPFNLTGLLGNTNYHYQLVAYNSAGTSSGSDVSFTTAGVPPATVTMAANGVTSSSATIGGSVNPNGSSTMVYFQWGTSTGYGYITPQQSAGSGTASVNISASLTGLSAKTTYHYQAVASNNAGTSYGSDVFFTTGNPSPPTVTTTAAGNVAFYSASLNGTVNPNGSATTVDFQWGTTTAYGNTTPAQSMGSGSTQLSVSANLSGLLANTTYHCRLIASSSAGTNYGSDVSFTTNGSTERVNDNETPLIRI
jgi:hypothetical protein